MFTTGIPDLAHLVMFTPQPHKPRETVNWDCAWQTSGALGKDTTLLDFAAIPTAQAASGVGIAVLLSTKKDGRVFRLSDGRHLATFEPNSLANHRLTVSGNGKFVAVATFTSDVMVR